MWLRRPNKNRNGFTLYTNGWKVVQDPRITLLNNDYRAGAPIDELERRVQEIRLSLKPPKLQSLAHINSRLAKQALKEKGYLKAPLEAERRLLRAVEYLGNLSVLTATKDQLKNKLQEPSKIKKNYLIGGINELLRFAGRDIRLKKLREKPLSEVAHITLDNFLRATSSIKDDAQRTYLECLYATGCRWGELACIEIAEDGKSVWVGGQVKRNGERTGTKTDRTRVALVIPKLMPSIMRYKEHGSNTMLKVRLTHQTALYEAFKALTGLRIHDIRHSYAVHLARQGFPVSKIALYLGNGQAVCERYYSRFIASKPDIERDWDLLLPNSP